MAVLNHVPDSIQAVVGIHTQQISVSLPPKMLGTFVRLSSGFYYPHPRIIGVSPYKLPHEAPYFEIDCERKGMLITRLETEL
jgi:hypothetical protein